MLNYHKNITINKKNRIRLLIFDNNCVNRALVLNDHDVSDS